MIVLLTLAGAPTEALIEGRAVTLTGDAWPATDGTLRWVVTELELVDKAAPHRVSAFDGEWMWIVVDHRVVASRPVHAVARLANGLTTEWYGGPELTESSLIEVIVRLRDRYGPHLLRSQPLRCLYPK